MTEKFRSIAFFVALSACSDASGRDFVEDLAPDALGLIRIDVFPPAENELTDDRGLPLDLRPATFFVEAAGEQRVELTMRPAVSVAGVVTGMALTPFAAGDLPTVPGPLAGAEIRFDLDSAVQRPRTTTDEDGAFDVFAVPETLDYDLVIVPATADVPMTRRKVQIVGATRTLDVFVEAGVPVWGRVEDDFGRDVPGAKVRLVDEFGTVSAAATTDAQGRYMIAAEKGASYLVLFEGRTAQDPVVRVPSGPIEEYGSEVPLQVGALEVGAVTGRILGPTGRPMADGDVRVRLVALSLDGLEGADAAYDIDVGIEDGVFTAVVPDGTYRLEVAPQQAEGPAPRVVSDVGVRGAVTRLGDIALEAASARFGWVSDESGAPVGGASVRCTEVGFAGRTWSVSTDPLGQFLLQIPATPMSCATAPPSTRPDLALSRRTLDDATAMDPETAWDLTLRAGSLLSGSLLVLEDLGLETEDSPRSPLGGAVLEVRNDAGDLLGIAISDPEGRFQLRIDR
jgi:hypothetical protein